MANLADRSTESDSGVLTRFARRRLGTENLWLTLLFAAAPYVLLVLAATDLFAPDRTAIWIRLASWLVVFPLASATFRLSGEARWLRVWSLEWIAVLLGLLVGVGVGIAMGMGRFEGDVRILSMALGAAALAYLVLLHVGLLYRLERLEERSGLSSRGNLEERAQRLSGAFRPHA